MLRKRSIVRTYAHPWFFQNIFSRTTFYIGSQGNITVTIVCTAISVGITQGISYYKD